MELDNRVLMMMVVENLLDLDGVMVCWEKRGRPRKGIVPDGFIQLRIQNFVTKFDIQKQNGGGGVQPGGVGGSGGGVNSANRGLTKKVETGCHGRLGEKEIGDRMPWQISK
jgi:hypothetical protein